MAAALVATTATVSACSTADIVGDAITGGGTDVFASDGDPQLVREAIPFGLKIFESLLAESPNHKGLLLACARGFTAYAYLIQNEADQIDETDLKKARAQRVRASKLYLRGRDYALRGLEAAHKGFGERLRTDRAGALAMTGADDVAFIYWAGAAWAAALGADKRNLGLVAEFPIAGALVKRVVELDESFEDGSAHEFLVSYEAGRPGGSTERAREHYRKALKLSKGARATTHLALAEAVSIKEQKVSEFRSLLDKVMAFDPDSKPKFRLVNTLARERARWLKKRIPNLFLTSNGSRSPS